MKIVKVYFENGNFLVTRINGTDEEIKRHYLNQYFEQWDFSTFKCVKVEFLE